MQRGNDTSFVTTRWAGSKRRLLGALERVLAPLPFGSAVDVFSGSGAVAHLLKRMGKQVHANDALASCHETAVALVVNGRLRLDDATAAALFTRRAGRAYDDVVERSFGGLYFLDEENRALDVAVAHVRAIEPREARALAWHALFQACLRKRPYALFHRANLAVRTREVARSFGNKRSWDAPFEVHLREALDEAHAALVDDGRTHTASRLDALACPLDAELVYLDPPYVRADGRGFDYADGYHLLEALLDYDELEQRLDRRLRHRPYRAPPATDFSRAKTQLPALAALVDRAPRRAFVVLSYRADGTPSVDELRRLFERAGRSVEVTPLGGRPYALSDRAGAELVFVARPRA